MAQLSKKIARGPAYLDFTGRALHRVSPAADILHPGGALNANIADGKPITGRNVLDPDHFVTKGPPAAPPPVVPMPDQEEIQRQQRRRVALTQRTGRQSTILTNTDQLGP